jgi:GNAT superfamily N-acetyltransferase
MFVSDLLIRRAVAEDIPAIVAMLADDPRGAERETDAGHSGYQAAFLEIDADPNQFLAVGELGGEVVASLQLTIIPGLSRQGSKRGLIEAVRVRGDLRGGGLGHQLMRWAIEETRARGGIVVQLTTDRTRADAHRFYLSLGFVDSHIGMKLAL